jgi:hypothetical protein
MPTRRNLLAIVAGVVPALATKAAETNPFSWFKPVKPERQIEVVVNLPRSHWNLIAELFRKQLAGEGSPITDRKLTEGILRKIERVLAEPETEGPLSVEATVLSVASVLPRGY